MKPTGEQREELVEELVTKERLITKMKDAMKADAKRHKEKIAVVENRRDEVLDLLEGKVHHQPTLPFAGPGKDGKKAPPPPLEWHPDGPNDVATTPTGKYFIDSNTKLGAFLVNFIPTSGRAKKLGEESTRGPAKALAQKDWVERAADAILENAGDGKLTGKIRGLEKVK